MSWWAWLLVVWAGLALALGLWIGAAAAIARRRERAARRFQLRGIDGDAPHDGD